MSCQKLFLRCSVSMVFACLAIPASAIELTSAPHFHKTTNSPLAGTLTVGADDYSRVTVEVADGKSTWRRRFYDSARTHSIPLAGFKPGRTNQITVTVHDQFGNAVVAAPVEFVTAPLPADFPKLTLLHSRPERMEPGYTIFRTLNLTGNRSYVMAVDNEGEVVWYTGVASSFEVRQLPNGNLLLPLPGRFVELNILGDAVGELRLPAAMPYHHEAFPTDRGTILYLSDASRFLTNFPTPASVNNPEAPRRTTNVWHNPVVEIVTATGQITNTWTTLDILDPRRVTYLTFALRGVRGWDIQHANAVIADPRDDSVIVSIRHQNAIIKFSRQTGQLKWILGPHEGWAPEFQPYLLKPVGEKFAWSYASHAPMLTPQGTLLIYDNGNFRAMPFEPSLADASNYTRAVEYHIDEERMEVSQLWEFGRDSAERFFTPTVGDADWLEKSGNLLITFGDIRFINGVRPSPIAPDARMVRIQEVTHEANPEIVFDLAVYDYAHTHTNYRGVLVYRSDRIPDLYACSPLARSLEELLAAVAGAANRPGQNQVAGLQSALAALERGSFQVVANELRAFQNKLRAQLSGRDSEQSARWIHQAQGIIDQVGGE